jgi:crotonobetainyl-CoA:carnitine CoA-transferase CaiB-like acyl-CoA transferase
VIKVERPGQGDWLRHVPPLDPESGQGLLFQALNRGKKSLTLDLKSAAGREVMLQLVETADVVLEGFRPGVMERLGLSYETLAQINPRLVYCSLSGYGPDGPYRDRAGHDLNYIGLAGLLDLTGSRGGVPVIPGVPVADLVGALWAAVGILLALLERERTGKGERVDTSLLGGALSCMPLAVAQVQGGWPMERVASDLTGGVVCYQIYETRDGKYVTLAALEPEFWVAFCRAVGQDDLLDQQYAPAVPGEPAFETLCTLFRGHTREEWAVVLAGVDACCEPVYTLEEALQSAPVKALGMLTEGVGGGLRLPITITPGEVTSTGAAPTLGQHTAGLLASLGYSAGEIERLRGEGVV